MTPGEALDAALADLSTRIAALGPPVQLPGPVPVPEPVPTPTPVPEPVPVPTPTPEPSPTPVVDLATVTTSDGTVWTFRADGRVLANGTPFDNWAWGSVPDFRAEAFQQNGSGSYARRADGQWFAWDGSLWAVTTADAGGQPQPVPAVSAPPVGGSTPPPQQTESPNASPDGTVVDKPWQPITDWNGDTYVLSDRKGSKNGGASYVGYECGRVFDQMVPGLAEQIPWTPATNDGVTLPARWVPLDESYQPIADGRPAFKFALVAGEGYGYAFKFAYVKGNLYQFAGTPRWYLSSRPGLRLEAWRSEGATDPFQPPPVVIPALITPMVGHRVMVGGWRFPIGQNSTLANPGTGQHCLAIDFDTMRAYVSTSSQGSGTVMEFRLPTMGKGSDPSTWPLLAPAREFPAWWPYGYTSGLLFWRGKFWAAPKVYYDTAPTPTMQIIAEDGETITLPLPRQAFAGFVKRGPGKDPYIGCGGDESGSGGMRGPSLARMDGTRLIEYGRPFQLAEPGDPLAHWHDCAPREPNYFTYDHSDSWVSFEPRVIDGVLQGRWAADRVFAGGLEFDGEIHFWAWMATGEVNYLRQEPTFGKWQDRRTYDYRYDASTFKLKGYELTGLGEVRGHELGPDGTVYLSFLHQWSHPSLGMTVGAFK